MHTKYRRWYKLCPGGAYSLVGEGTYNGIKSGQEVVLVGRNQATASGRVSMEAGTHYGCWSTLKKKKRQGFGVGGSPTEKVWKENLSSWSLCPLLTWEPSKSLFFLLCLRPGSVSGSDYVDDDHKQTRSWIWLWSVYFLERHGDSI